MRHLLIESVREHAERTGLDSSTVRRRCSDGKLNAIKTGRSWAILSSYDDSVGKVKPRSEKGRDIVRRTKGYSA